VARCIWLRRNFLIFNDIFTHPNVVFAEAEKSLTEIKKCQIKESRVMLGEVFVPCNTNVKWQPPPHGLIKVNWDASINKNKGWMGLGLIARDSNGACLGAKSETKELVADSATTEAMAALSAMYFCMEVGFFEVITEGDAIQVLKAINSYPPFLSKFGHFVESIHYEKRYFKSVDFSFTPREGNAVAHALATEASKQKVNNVWLEDLPSRFSNIVTRELIGP
jgi:ribonuclease HI